MGVWVITRWDGDRQSPERIVPGHLSEREIRTILQRLVCRHLNEDEILSASLRQNDSRRTALLDQVGTGALLSYGDNPCYTAEFRD